MKAARAGGVQGSVTSIDQETELLKRVAAGDGEAFAELFTRIAPRVLGFLVRLMRRRSLAEEALQETFLQIWLRAEAYRPDLGSPLYWALKIARSRGIDLLRREISRRRRRDGFGHLSTTQRACLAE